jgi:hypothetical protein
MLVVEMHHVSFVTPTIIKIVIIYDKNFHYLCSFYEILGTYMLLTEVKDVAQKFRIALCIRPN